MARHQGELFSVPPTVGLTGSSFYHRNPRYAPKTSHFTRGSLLTHLGLAGFWGSFWHTLFRDGLVACAKALVPSASLRQQGAQILRIMVVFILSGLIHAAGSYAASRDLNVALRTILFFCAQPVGIMLQRSITRLSMRSISRKHKPAATYIIVSISTAAWGHLTLPLLFDDLISIGVISEVQVPFSIFSAFG